MIPAFQLPHGLCLSLALSLGFVTAGANAQPAYMVADLGDTVPYGYEH